MTWVRIEMMELKLPSHNHGGSSRRCRTRFSPSQVETLEQVFNVTHYPCAELTEDIAQKTGLPETRIQIWFQNRRAKWRKHSRLLNFGGLEGVTETRFVPAPRAEDTVLSPNKEEDSALMSFRADTDSGQAEALPPKNQFIGTSGKSLVVPNAGLLQRPQIPVMFSFPYPFFSPIILFGPDKEKETRPHKRLSANYEDRNPCKTSVQLQTRVHKNNSYQNESAGGLDLSKRSCCPGEHSKFAALFDLCDIPK